MPGPTVPHPPPPAHCLDLTRLTSRAGSRPTGVDRVEFAYLRHLLPDAAPLWGLVRTSLGYLLLDRTACAETLERLDGAGFPPPGPLDRLARRGDPARAGAEARLRRIATARALPSRLGAMLRRHLPAGTRYLNVGHTNLTDRTLAGLRAVPDLRIAVMIHDTIPLDWPDLQRPGTPDRFARFLDRAGRHADLLIATSRATASDIARHLPDPRPATVVAPLGVPRPDAGPAPRGPWTGRPYFVVLGTVEPRKNHALLLDLWEKMGDTAPPLLVCGRRGWENHATFARLDAHPPQVHELPGLPDPEIFGLLAESAGLLFPSFAEGYGLPLLEAAALGVPVLCNDLAVFREIAGEFPIYATIGDHYRWHHNIKTLERAAAALDDGQKRRRPGIDPPRWDAHFAIVSGRLGGIAASGA